MHNKGRAILSKQLQVLDDKQEPSFLLETLPSISQLCKAFPILTEEAVNFLIGTVLVSFNVNTLSEISPPKLGISEDPGFSGNPQLNDLIQKAFNDIVSKYTS